MCSGTGCGFAAFFYCSGGVSRCRALPRLPLPTAATVRELYSAICHVWSGLYAVIDEATFSVLGPKSF